MREAILATLEPQLTWLRDSGIQIADGLPDAGGVHAWLDETPGSGPPRPGFIYSEITGYFMTLCRQLARVGGAEWVARGERAAAWIVEHAMHPSGAVLSRKYDDRKSGEADPYSFDNGRIAFFDCAMVGFGLLQIHALTGTRRWLDAAARIGAFLDSALGSAIADHHASFDVLSLTPVPPADRWSGAFRTVRAQGRVVPRCARRCDGRRGAAQEVLPTGSSIMRSRRSCRRAGFPPTSPAPRLTCTRTPTRSKG